MSNTTLEKKNRNLCILSIALCVGCYALERVLEIFTTMDKNTSLIMAMIGTVALACVYFLVSKTKDTFYGLLAALIGYKMMPPSISTLMKHTTDGAVLYYLVGKVAVVLFVLLIIKHYKTQTEERNIKLIPLVALMVVVPFCSEVSSVIGGYLTHLLGGSMVYTYFTQYIFYIIALVVVLGVALRSNYDTLRFVCYYEFVALSINFLKRLALIVAVAIKGNHISKSYFIWLAIFAAGIALFAVVKENRKKAELSK